MHDIVELIRKVRILPMLLPGSVSADLKFCETLVKNGLPAAMISFRQEDAEETLREISGRFPGLLLGAETVSNPDDLHRAFDSGARFATAPVFDRHAAAEAADNGFLFAPAVSSPEECAEAAKIGLRLLEFYPAESSGGPAGLQLLSAACGRSGIQFITAGGITPVNAGNYLVLPEVAAVGGTWLNQCAPEVIREAAALAGKYGRL